MIPGETGETYTTTAADVGFVITRRVTATNAAGSASRTSAGIGPVVAASTVDRFTVSPTGPYFVDPSNVPAGTTRIECEARIRFASLPPSGNISLFEQESTGLQLGIASTGRWRVNVEDGSGTQMLPVSYGAASVPAGTWMTVGYDVDMVARTARILVDGVVTDTFAFTGTPSPATFQSNREISFFATSGGGSKVAGLGVGSVECEYVNAWFTTGGVRTLRKQISGSAATVNADAWKAGTDAS